jgi:hypothetical protein
MIRAQSPDPAKVQISAMPETEYPSHFSVVAARQNARRLKTREMET